MAFGVGNLGNIVADFKDSLNQIFGLGTSSGTDKMGTMDEASYGGIAFFDPSKWTGNTINPTNVKYGFKVLSSIEILKNTSDVTKASTRQTDSNTYYLDIPPQAITQKEIFSTAIQATRKGIIVETEGVVFKDIIIQGTTGIFPGKRGNFNGPQANLNLIAPPSPPSGVDIQTGKSKASNIKEVSGYEEFLALRQYFLKYAHDKLQKNGDLFLVFINEKDNQTLIVEPLEFTMERNSKSPLTYNYKIVLKAIGTLNLIFNDLPPAQKSLLEQILDGIGNVSANLSAGIGQARAAINATSSTLQRTFQAIDQTVNGPLRQVQFALEDLSNGLSDTLSLPAILSNNFTSAIAGIRENASTIASTLGFNNSTSAASGAATISFQQDTINHINNDSRVQMPRSFVDTVKTSLQTHSDNLADSLNLGDPLYNQIKGRTPTDNPGPLKVASDEEFLLLGNIQKLTDTLNQVLATNSAFQTDAEKEFTAANAIFTNTSLLQSNPDFEFTKPVSVRQIRIQQNDTLEKIAARELKNVLRWPELVILNKLKPPYLSPAGGDGVKRPGEFILVGD